MGLVVRWRRFALRTAIKQAVKQPVKYPLITSEPGSFSNNFLAVKLSDNPNPRIWTFRIESINGDEVTGIYFAQVGGLGTSKVYKINELLGQRFEGTHYYRGLHPSYATPEGFLLASFFSLSFLLLQYNRIAQFFFNRKRLARRDRTNVLRLFLENTVRKHDFAVGEVGVLSRLYGKRWHRHSQGDALMAYYGLILESLAGSKDLIKEAGGYRLTPKGIETLDQYEGQESRHRDNFRIQFILAALTAILAAITLTQIGVSVWEELHPDPATIPNPVGDNQLSYPTLPPELFPNAPDGSP
ncbi:hypothetical protein [Mesorhizobium sp.]|uniref:hypothetical protein n=1 Tax=Mesorhizobium sp. TaxID=1871066 RepID=UPI000FE98D32|nr:hypothetical protein [Mesorhizobium sp.]RWN24289.1 MAG: hypothetical protein EOR95_33520 [Mesorhizobium sp.]